MHTRLPLPKKTIDKVYSLPHPESNKKSSDLCLPFVKEVVTLHGGPVELINSEETGVKAVVCLPAE